MSDRQQKVPSEGGANVGKDLSNQMMCLTEGPYAVARRLGCMFHTFSISEHMGYAMGSGPGTIG